MQHSCVDLIFRAQVTEHVHLIGALYNSTSIFLLPRISVPLGENERYVVRTTG